MEEKLKTIILGSIEMFKKYGVKSVTMDDISRELAISKKTLYKYVSDKRELVVKAVDFYLEEHQEKFAEIAEKKLNAIDTLLSITQYFGEFMSDMNLSVTYDLQKYYPEAWAKISRFKKEHSLEKIALNIRHGQEQGLYKKSINPDIISIMYSSCMDAVFNPDNFRNSNYTLFEIFWEIVKYHIRGIASRKGLEYFEEKLKEEGTSNKKL